MRPRHGKMPIEMALSEAVLNRQNASDQKFGRRSQENRHYGFRPAFIDIATGAIYRSCFADGRPAPFHLLESLPDEVVAERDFRGEVTAAWSSVIAGFVRHGRFYSREEAASLVSKARDASVNRRAPSKRHSKCQATALARMGRAA